jgi:hypothetical protein
MVWARLRCHEACCSLRAASERTLNGTPGFRFPGVLLGHFAVQFWKALRGPRVVSMEKVARTKVHFQGLADVQRSTDRK